MDTMEQAREVCRQINGRGSRWSSVTDTDGAIIASALTAARAQADAELYCLREALLAQHHQRLDRGDIGIPDGDGGWVAINEGVEYSESSLFDRTIAALDRSPRAAAVAEVLGAARTYRQSALEGPADYEFDRLCDAVAKLDDSGGKDD